MNNKTKASLRAFASVNKLTVDRLIELFAACLWDNMGIRTGSWESEVGYAFAISHGFTKCPILWRADMAPRFMSSPVGYIHFGISGAYLRCRHRARSTRIPRASVDRPSQ